MPPSVLFTFLFSLEGPNRVDQPFIEESLSICQEEMLIDTVDIPEKKETDEGEKVLNGEDYQIQDFLTQGATVVNPSPESMSMINRINAGADLYNGTLTSGVNFHTLVENDITVPVGLSYSSNGVKVDDYGSEVGQTWQLSAGGKITRIMKSFPDERVEEIPARKKNLKHRNFFGEFMMLGVGYLSITDEPDGSDLPVDLFEGGGINIENFNTLSGTDKRRIAAYSKGDQLTLDHDLDLDNNNPMLIDTEPDEFYYNFGKYSGKFVFSQDGSIKQIPKQNLTIVPIYSPDGGGTFRSFTVRTPEGYIYTFGNFDGSGVETSSMITTTMNNKYAYRFQDHIDEHLQFDTQGPELPPEEASIPAWIALVPQPVLTSEKLTFTESQGGGNNGGNWGYTAVTHWNKAMRRTTKTVPFNSTWHLTKIESPLSDESKVTFTYENDSDILYTVQKSISASYPDFRLLTTTSTGTAVLDENIEETEPNPNMALITPRNNYFSNLIPQGISHLPDDHDTFYKEGSVNSYFTYSVQEVEMNKQRLMSIDGKVGGSSITFSYDIDRTDMESKLLTDISLFYDSNSIKKWELDYVHTSKFVNEKEDIGCAVQVDVYPTEDVYDLDVRHFDIPETIDNYYFAPTTDYRCEHAYLRSYGDFVATKSFEAADYEQVDFNAGKQLASFVREHNRSFLTNIVEKSGEDELDVARFDYWDLANLPQRFSYKQNEHGYYDNNNGPRLPNVLNPKTKFGWAQLNTPNALPVPFPGSNIEKLRSGSLKKITYPLSGLQKGFGYGYNNQYANSGSLASSVGIRISSIHTSGPGVNISENFHYSEGQLMNKNIRYINDGTALSYREKNIRVSSSSMSEMLSTKSARVGYGRVRVIKTDAGSTEYTFTTKTDYPNIIPEVEELVTSFPHDATYIAPFPRLTEFSHRHGLMTSALSYDDSGSLVQRKTYQYAFLDEEKVFGLKGMVNQFRRHTGHDFEYNPNSPNSEFEQQIRAGLYEYTSESIQLASSTTETHYPNEGSTSSETDYTYNGNNALTNSLTTFSNGQTAESRVFYPADLSGASGIYDVMLDRGMKSVPVKSETYQDGALVGGDYTISRVTGSANVIAPEFMHEVRDGHFVVSGRATAWDTNGNMVRYRKAKATVSDDTSLPVSNEHYFPLSEYKWTHYNQLERATYEGFTKSYDYNNVRLLERARDENGIVSEYKYDSFRRLKQGVSANGRVTQDNAYGYTPLKTYSNITYSDGTPTQTNITTMDALGRPISVEQTGRVVSSVSYDGAGRKTSEFALGAGTSAYTYIHSPIGQMLTSTDGAGNKINYEYSAYDVIGENAYARSTVIEDLTLNTTHTSSDAFGLVTGVRDAIDGETLRYYDASNRLISVQPPLGDSYSYTYTNRDLLATKTVPLEGMSSYTYDTRDRMVVSVDASGNSIGIKYDNLDRPTKTGLSSGGTPVADCDCVEENSASLSEVLTTTEYEGGKTWAISGSERVIKPDNSLSEFLHFRNTKDDLGRVTNDDIENFTGSNTSSTTYNDANLITGMRFGHDGHESVSMGYRYTYDNLLRPVDTQLGFNEETTLLTRLAYNAQDQVINKYLHSENNGGSFLQNISYDYDGGGRLIRINNLANLGDCMSADLCDYELQFYFGPDNEVLVQQIIASTGIVSGLYTITISPDDGIIEGVEELIAGINAELSEGGYIGQASYEVGYDPLQGAYLTLTINNSSLVFEEAWIANNEEVDRIGFTAGDCCQIGGEDEGDGEGGEPESSSDLFVEHITYTGFDITKIGYQTNCQGGYNTYNFSYDPLHRLEEGLHSVRFWNPEGFFETETGRYDVNLGYDAIGNITSLNRNGFRGVGDDGILIFDGIDQLTYDYTDNRKLTQVTEAIPTAVTTKGYPKTGEIGHDGSGRMTSEGGKGIGVGYNLLNLPGSLSNPLGDVANIYAASGRKIYKIAPNAEGEMEEREYAGAVEYVDREIESIYHPEGRLVKNPDEKWVYEYAIKDHLGSTRVVFADIDDDGEVTYEEVLHENHYYPFGMNMEGEWTQPDPDFEVNAPFAYQYTGKELNVGVEWTDYGARWYDAQIGRFTTVDPLADIPENVSWSPYNYVRGNPISFIDPDGRNSESTIVRDNFDGSYTVTDYIPDGMTGVYVGSLSGEMIGHSLTPYSFSVNGEAAYGAIIDMDSSDGQEFLNNLYEDDPSPVKYAINAKNNQIYDYKHLCFESCGNWEEDIAYMYRGSVLDNGLIVSGRDVGNIGAGWVAGKNDLKWNTFRIAADQLETKQRTGNWLGVKPLRTTSPTPIGPGGFYFRRYTEGMPTQAAEYYGWKLGLQDRPSYIKSGAAYSL